MGLGRVPRGMSTSMSMYTVTPPDRETRPPHVIELGELLLTASELLRAAQSFSHL